MWRDFEVAEVIASLPLDIAVPAGAGGLRRRIRRVVVADRAEEFRQVGARDLLMTTVETLRATGEPWEQLVERFEGGGIAGVAVHLVPSSDRLPAEFLTAADRASLPVIICSSGATLPEVRAAILAALLEIQGRRLDHVIDIRRRFAALAAATDGLSRLAAALHDMLGVSVAVIDADGSPLVVVPPDTAGPLARSGGSGERRPIDAGDRHYGHVVAFTGGVTLDDDLLVAFDEASAAMAVHLAQMDAAAAAQERFAEVTLEQLISGQREGVSAAVERARSFGWDLAEPRAVLLASVDPPTDDHLSAALSTIAAAARATVGSEAIVWTRSTTIAALIAPATDEAVERRQIAERLRHELDRRVRTVTVSIGVGRRVDDPTLLSRSFVEASRAVDVGRWAKGRHVTELFDELGLERLLASTPTDDLDGFVAHTIGPLIEHDRLHRTDLVETLWVWLQTRNMAEAARRTHVHYNTFKNRLDRIESIVGPVMGDPTRSLECEIAIHVARNYEGSWTTSDPGA